MIFHEKLIFRENGFTKLALNIMRGCLFYLSWSGSLGSVLFFYPSWSDNHR